MGSSPQYKGNSKGVFGDVIFSGGAVSPWTDHVPCIMCVRFP